MQCFTPKGSTMDWRCLRALCTHRNSVGTFPFFAIVVQRFDPIRSLCHEIWKHVQTLGSHTFAHPNSRLFSRVGMGTDEVLGCSWPTNPESESLFYLGYSRRISRHKTARPCIQLPQAFQFLKRLVGKSLPQPVWQVAHTRFCQFLIYSRTIAEGDCVVMSSVPKRRQAVLLRNDGYQPSLALGTR